MLCRHFELISPKGRLAAPQNGIMAPQRALRASRKRSDSLGGLLGPSEAVESAREALIAPGGAGELTRVALPPGTHSLDELTD